MTANGTLAETYLFHPIKIVVLRLGSTAEKQSYCGLAPIAKTIIYSIIMVKHATLSEESTQMNLFKDGIQESLMN